MPRKLKTYALNHFQTGGAGVSKDALRNKRRVVKLVTIVTVMFALSWLPIQVIVFENMILYAKSDAQLKFAYCQIWYSVNIYC